MNYLRAFSPPRETALAFDLSFIYFESTERGLQPHEFADVLDILEGHNVDAPCGEGICLRDIFEYITNARN